MGEAKLQPDKKVEEAKPQQEKINQNQFFELITRDELGWQAIVYDLIKTEQLDPWDINLGILADKYSETIQQLEEADFFISSKVLLACALLLRLKSEILANEYIQSLNDALYGRKEETRYGLERIEIDEDELPILIPRTPVPRHKKVTLKELMSALNQAIETENRRIKREIHKKQAEKSALVVLPKLNKISLKDKVKQVFLRLKAHLNKPEQIHMTYSELAPTKEEKLASFLPVLHLTNQQRVYLKQEVHFEEIYMALDRFEEEIREIRKQLEEENKEDKDFSKYTDDEILKQDGEKFLEKGDEGSLNSVDEEKIDIKL